MLLPGAVLVGTGIQVLHALTAYVVLPNLERSSELYGTAGGVSVLLFWMYLVARLVVMSPILNSSLHAELLTRRDEGGDQDTPPAASASFEDGPVGRTSTEATTWPGNSRS